MLGALPAAVRAAAGRILAVAILIGVVAPAMSSETPFAGHGGPVKDLAWDDASRRLISVGFDYALMFWEPTSGRVVARIVGHDGPLNAVAVAAAERLVATASDDGTVGLFDLSAGHPVVRLAGHEAKVVAVAVSPDGQQLASAGWDGTVRLWSLAERRELRRFGVAGRRYTGVAFAGEQLLAAADDSGGLVLWDVARGAARWQVEGNGFPVTRLIAHGRMLFTGSIDGTIRGWDIADGAERLRLEGQEKPVLSLALSPDGNWLASGTAAGTIYVWNIPEVRGDRVLRSEGGPAWALAFAADGRQLYSGHRDGAIRVWDRLTGEQIAGPTALHLAATEQMLGEGRGAELFRKCVGCHSVTPDDENKAGPTFHRLIGRRAGAVPGYPYSAALARSNIVWTEETLSRLFELGPEQFVPGSRMPLQRMPDAEDRAALVAYIATIANGEQPDRPSRAETGR